MGADALVAVTVGIGVRIRIRIGIGDGVGAWSYVAEVKICSTCRRALDASRFNRRKRSSDGLQATCRECNREQARRYYAEHREAHVRAIMERRMQQRREAIDFVRIYLFAHPCVDCSESDLRVLDFDHRPGTVKTKDVMRLVQDGYSIARISREIESCDVRCRNCHARVTYERLGRTWRNHRHSSTVAHKGADPNPQE